ncbi:hypothetical protein QBC40DRAFT_269641 [Triangularia verruculosa]|uniref:Uncharacterized protein n=1 Tax=Triangularia verruculosa TaxID=2587418 RepID=A0AAN6X6Y0_9PEZI|nr:hypothetical protein QBC40DRAFT_269641 [Triangularia verruculosa]
MDKGSLRCFWALLFFLVIGFSSACTSYGVDYSNGGAYYIDGSSNQYFSFITIFQSCGPESISPVLIGPDDNQYVCSVIGTGQAGVQVTSTCGIPFSAMKSGNWKIILSGNQISTQRTFSVTVGVPETTYVTATPTVVVGVTTTARASTVLTTLVQTQTLIIVPRTVTATCSGPTRTVTSYPQAPTTTVRSTVTRTETDGQITNYWTTVVTTTARCHYPTRKRDVAATPAAQVAAITSTITQTTYTVTSTTTTTVAGRVTTETVLRTTTATVTPPPSTVCAGNAPGATVTVIRTQSAVTETNVVYLTSHLSGTVWVGQTQYTTVSNPVSATACWRAGGWYGK